jgi:hypothetical protein
VRLLVVTYCFLMSLTSFSQQLFYSETLNGGVTGVGFSAGFNSATVTSSVLIEAGSTIKKAYLIGVRQGNKIEKATVNLNSIDYEFSNNTVVTDGFISAINSTYSYISSVHAIDITSDIDPSVVNYLLTTPTPDMETVYYTFYLYIVYENPALPLITCNLFLNTQDVSPFTTWNLTEINPVEKC